MGRVAAELLLARLSGSATGEYQQILLPTKVVVRRSSAPPPG
jgi:DNA-binding LacI/PurR family transcriptional regulator